MTRRHATIVAGAAGVLLVAWFMLLWQPKGNELTEARARQDTADEQVTELQSKLSRLKSAQARAPQLVATLDRLRSAVPEDPGLAQFILDTNDAASAAGVSFISISPVAPKAATTPGLPAEIDVSVEIAGGYFEVLSFIDTLMTMPRVLVVDTFSMLPGEETGGPVDLAVKIGGRMFTTATPPGAPAAAAPAPAPGTSATPPQPVSSTPVAAQAGAR